LESWGQLTVENTTITLVVKNEKQTGTHKTTVATSRDYKETRNLQHRDQRSRRRQSVGEILKI
jgi:hypothetical protein